MPLMSVSPSSKRAIYKKSLAKINGLNIVLTRYYHYRIIIMSLYNESPKQTVCVFRHASQGFNVSIIWSLIDSRLPRGSLIDNMQLFALRTISTQPTPTFFVHLIQFCFIVSLTSPYRIASISGGRNSRYRTSCLLHPALVLHPPINRESCRTVFPVKLSSCKIRLVLRQYAG